MFEQEYDMDTTNTLSHSKFTAVCQVHVIDTLTSP